MSVIDNAIARLQALALACSSSDVVIRSAQTLPTGDAVNLPMAVAHITSGQATAMNKTDMKFEPVVSIDFHFNRSSLRQAYKEIDIIAVEYPKRLAGDPTLSGTVDTIQFPVTFDVSPVEWDRIQTQMLRFSVSLKTLETPTT